MIAIDERSGSGRTHYPVSFAQERFFEHERVRPGDPASNATLRWQISGDLNQGVLEQAWRALLARHPMLRTGFTQVGPRTLAVVEPTANMRISIVDCSALDRAVVESEVARVAARDARVPFDLAKPPLIRVTRVVVAPQVSVLVVTAHQIVCDGWSFGLLAREMGQLCDAFGAGETPALPELSTTFGEYARWQRAALTDDALAEEFSLLRSDFSGAVPYEPPLDRERPAKWSSNVDTCTRVLDRGATERLLRHARDCGATPFVAFLATLAQLLRERSGVPNITLTTQVAGRDDVDLENVVGVFVNTMPLRIDVAPALTFDDMLARVNDVVANAFELRHVPYERVETPIFGEPKPDHGSTCSVHFVYQKAFTQDVDYRNFRIESQPSRPGGSACDLNFYVVERPSGWRLSCDYNPDLFDSGTVEGLLARFEGLVAQNVDRREPVLFFHSDLFADGFYAEEIAASIAERRIVPVAPHGADGLPMFATIDEMADDYVARMAKIQPDGGIYRLIGFCAGAQVAFEVARRLRARGETVGEVILINATAPVRPVVPLRNALLQKIGRNARLGPGRRMTLIYNIARFNRAVLRGPVSAVRYLAGAIGSLVTGKRAGTGLHEGESYERTSGDDRTELSFAHITAVLAHHPHTYDGDVTLIWSEEQPSLTGEPTQGWCRLARSVSVVTIGGGHVALLHKLVGNLSTALRDVLAPAASDVSKKGLRT